MNSRCEGCSGCQMNDTRISQLKALLEKCLTLPAKEAVKELKDNTNPREYVLFSNTSDEANKLCTELSRYLIDNLP